MVIHRISANFYEHSYILMAIHCFLEDYKLAYVLNTHLHTKFRKLPDIDFHNNTTSFTLYQWEDQKRDTVWNLVSNISGTATVELKNNTTLFSKDSTASVSYLIPERKQTDFFLKIDGEIQEKEITTILNKINKIPQIITIYRVEPDQLKSKQNLILLNDA